MMDFDLANFPQYRIRNVARDKEVKATEALTYVWGRKNIVALNTVLRKSTKHLIDHCRLCGKGPFGSSKELSLHENSKTHKRKAKYQAEWLNYRASVSDGKPKTDKQEIN